MDGTSGRWQNRGLRPESVNVLHVLTHFAHLFDEERLHPCFFISGLESGGIRRETTNEARAHEKNIRPDRILDPKGRELFLKGLDLCLERYQGFVHGCGYVRTGVRRVTCTLSGKRKVPEYGGKVKNMPSWDTLLHMSPPQESSWDVSWQRWGEVCHSHKHLLEQPALEGLGLGDLGGYAFDLAVDG